MAFSLKNRTKQKNADTAGEVNSPLSGGFGAKKPIKNFSPQNIKKRKFVKSGKRHSLIIGDDGAILIYSDGAEVKTRQFIASPSPENLKEFEAVLAKNVKAPLFVIIDSMDQSFIQQSLPPISSLGVKKLINRRLDRDLGKDTIKGYILLERESSGRRDWNFLMVSLEKSPQLSVWLDFIESANNRLAGIFLLSVESENIIKNLDMAMGRSIKKPKKSGAVQGFSKWKIFVSNNKVGGFRQVILKDGRIIFTRLGQAVGDSTAEVVAGHIEQEMTSTVEYMKRLGFNPQQGLDVYVIASADINAQLDVSRMSADNVYKFTPFEVSQLLGVNGAAQINDQFGDVVLSASIAGNSKHRLVLFPQQALRVNNLYNIMVYQRGLAGLAVLVMLGYGGVQGFGAWQAYSSLEDLNQRKISQQNRLDKINDDIKNGGVDVVKINEMSALYDLVIKENNFELPFFMSLRAAIISAVSIKEISFVTDDTKAQPAPNSAQNNNGTINLVLRFPEISSTDEAFTSVARKVLKDVRAAFPDYKVIYTKLPDVLNKQNEGGKIDDKVELIKIAPEQLEATLSISKNDEKLKGSPDSTNGLSTDELIGLRRRSK